MSRRFTVVQIDRFGDSTELSYWDSLDDALSERDRHRRLHALGPRRGAFIVLDLNDRMRGPLDRADACLEA